jgi:hypothetical protein
MAKRKDSHNGKVGRGREAKITSLISSTSDRDERAGEGEIEERSRAITAPPTMDGWVKACFVLSASDLHGPVWGRHRKRKI